MPNRKKILFVSEYWPPFAQGGGEISMSLLAEGLAEQGVEVSVLTSHFPGTKKFEIKNKVKIYRRLKTGKNPSSLFSNLKRVIIFPRSVKKEVNKLLTEEKFDIVYYVNTTSALGLVKKQGVKSICHVNSPVFLCPKGTLIYKDKTECSHTCNFNVFLKCFINSQEFGKLKNKYYFKLNPLFWFSLFFLHKKRQKILKKFDLIIAISEFIKNKLSKLNISKNKIKILPNIINTHFFLKKLQNRKNKIPKILYIGALTKSKGVLVLLESLKTIKEPYKCNLYGNGILEEELKRFIKENDLQTKIKVHKKVPFKTIPKIIADHDIVVFPSLIPEGFGRVAIEAMAAKKPLVGTKSGAIKYLIQHGKNGFIVEPGNVNQLKFYIRKLLKNKKLREKLGCHGKKESKRFLKKVIVKKMLNLIK